MPKSINLIFGCHSHQPVGNFDFVFREAYDQAYAPFLDVLQDHPSVHVTFHITGPLWDWMLQHEPDYIRRVAVLVRERRIEVMGGGYYEPMLCAIPRRDAIAQIERMNRFCETHFGSRPRGMWLTERVWEPNMASTLAEAGIEYTALDDTHFLYAGLNRDQLFHAYTTEDEGRVIKVFPILERLRYLVPFHDVGETIDFLRNHATEGGDRCAVVHDDGEKFGVWPFTHKTVYEAGWLSDFFKAIEDNQDWLKCVTYSEYLDRFAPAGRVYMPCASYCEMMEWTLPVQEQRRFHALSTSLRADPPRSEDAELFVRGGFWRNFQMKYEEANNIQKRMLRVSARLQRLRVSDESKQIAAAERLLHEGQCNCAYWHGVFGGLYLNHLRTALYEKIIAADVLLDQIEFGTQAFVRTEAGDFDADGKPEVMLENDQLALWFKPSDGGTIYEIDSKAKPFNWCNVLTRREEAYHARITENALSADNLEGQTLSIHEMALVKEPGLEKFLVYDPFRRVSLRDRFFEEEMDARALWSNDARDVVSPTAPYDVERGENFLQLTRKASEAFPLQVSKRVSLAPGATEVQIEYDIVNVGTVERTLWWGGEFCFNLMAGAAPDRYYCSRDGQLDRPMLATRGECGNAAHFAMRDDWQQLEAGMSLDTPARVVWYPLETVSQSEGGQERVYQGSVIMPLWGVRFAPRVPIRRLVQLNFAHSALEASTPAHD